MFWGTSRIRELLDHRIKQTNTGDVIPDDILDTLERLLQRRQITTPRQLIQKGNNLLHKYTDKSRMQRSANYV